MTDTTAPVLLEPLPDAEGEVVELAADLIRIDTSNYGDGTGPGEAEAAEYVEARLREVGLDPERFACAPAARRRRRADPGTRPRRAVRCWSTGTSTCVPARADDWTRAAVRGRDPRRPRRTDALGPRRGRHEGHGRDDARRRARRGRATACSPSATSSSCSCPTRRPAGDIGSHWLVENRPDMFEGVTEAVGEVGGFSMTVRDDLRLYLVQTAEKGIGWLRLTATGRAGHGSMLNDDNAVTALCEAVARIGRHRLPGARHADACATSSRRCPRRPAPTLDPDDIDATLAQARPDGDARRRDPAEHRQPHDARGRVQGQRDPRRGHGARRRPVPARVRGGDVRGASTRSLGDRTSPASSSTTTSRSRRRSTARRIDLMAAALRAEDPQARGRAVHAVRRHRREGVQHAGHPLLRLRAAQAAARRSTSARSSTASTSGSRSTPSASAPGCSSRFLRAA